jgi:hypothetical protein
VSQILQESVQIIIFFLAFVWLGTKHVDDLRDLYRNQLPEWRAFLYGSISLGSNFHPPVKVIKLIESLSDIFLE